MASITEMKAQQAALAKAIKDAEVAEVAKVAAAKVTEEGEEYRQEIAKKCGFTEDAEGKVSTRKGTVIYKEVVTPLINEVIELRAEVARLKSVSAPKVAKKKGEKKVAGSQYQFAPFTEEDAEDLSAKKCHTRRMKRVDGVHQFFQCSKDAEVRGGYCSGCIKTHQQRADKGFFKEGDMAIGTDGDIRIWGGTPEQVTGGIRDENHYGFIKFGVCGGGDKPITHMGRPIPEEIITQFNLPRPTAE